MIENLDFFGSTVHFKFNGKAQYKSISGAITSISLMAFVVWASAYFGRDMVMRKNPKTNTSEYSLKTPIPVILSSTTFNLGFGLRDPVTYSHYIDESVYTIEAVYRQLNRGVDANGNATAQWTSLSLSVERCTLEHFSDFKSDFLDVDLNELYCISNEQLSTGDIQIQGTIDSSLFEYLSVSFKKCNTATSSIPCSSNDHIEYLLDKGLFGVFFTNVAIDPNDFHHPNVNYKDSYYTTIANSYSKEVFMSLTHVEVSSNVGLMLDELTETNFTKIDSIQEFINSAEDETDIMTLSVRAGKTKTRYDRSYTKIQNVLASINGFVTLGVIAGIIFVKPYSTIKFYETLINELFDVRGSRVVGKEDKSSERKRRSRRISKAMAYIVKNTSAPSIDKQCASRKSVFGSLEIETTNLNKLVPSRRLTTNILTTGVEQTNSPEGRRISLAIPREKSLQRISTESNNASFSEKPTGIIKSDFSQLLAKKFINDLNGNLIQNDILKKKQHQYQQPKTELNLLTVESPKAFRTLRLTRNTTNRVPRSQLKLLDEYEYKDPQKVTLLLGGMILGSNNEEESMSNQESMNAEDEIKSLKTLDKALVKKQTLSLFLASHGELKTPTQAQFQVHTHENEIDKKETIVHVEKPRTKVGITASKTFKAFHDYEKMNFTFWDYIRSFFFWKSTRLNRKLSTLKEGMKRINERLDIFNVLRKLREVDKLKVLLLENEQLVLFDNLPKPQLKIENTHNNPRNSKSFTQRQLREAKFIGEKAKNGLVFVSYEIVKKKEVKTIIDEKLVEIYDETLSKYDPDKPVRDSKM